MAGWEPTFQHSRLGAVRPAGGGDEQKGRVPEPGIQEGAGSAAQGWDPQLGNWKWSPRVTIFNGENPLRKPREDQ